jgi:Uma2 family endonuclease
VTVTVIPELEPIGRVLTAEEYDALPENPRRELVDGVIQMMAVPTSWHQTVKEALYLLLRRSRPNDLAVLAEMEIRLKPLLRRVPDIVVVHRSAFARDRNRYEPSEVVLAAEVVSPGSQSTDRLYKPAEYAAAGIEHYWRVEIDPDVVVYTYWLVAPGRYDLTGTFKTGDTVTVPALAWVSMDVAELADEG